MHIGEVSHDKMLWVWMKDILWKKDREKMDEQWYVLQTAAISNIDITLFWDSNLV